MVSVARQRQFRIELLDRKADRLHTSESTESARIASAGLRQDAQPCDDRDMNSSVSQPTGVRHREKLWPAWWLWVAAAIIGGSLSTAFFPVSIFYGVLALVVGMALCVSALIATTPTIEITDDVVRVGRARISHEDLGRAVAHRGPAAREQLGPGFDARSYQCIRGWIDPVMTVEISDPQDPTPYWLFSTRHPEAVLAALGSEEPVRETGVSISQE